MSRKFRVAVVGCGNIAQLHAACLTEEASARIVAAVDTKIERAEALALPHGAEAFMSYSQMLTEIKPDVVHLCTPHYLHAEMAMEAAKAGVAVFTEKPPAMNRAGWNVLTAASDLMAVGICFQNRYNPNVQETLKRLNAGEFGSVRGARSSVYWMRDADYYNDDWHGTWSKEGGGALINQAIHTLDLMNLFVNRPVSDVKGSMSNRSLNAVIEVEDTLEAYIDYGGVPAMFFATNAYSTNAPVLIELDCERARVVLEGSDLIIHWLDRDSEVVNLQSGLDTGFKDYWGKGHATCIADFYHALSERLPVPIGIEAVASTMELVYRIYESCGRPDVANQLAADLKV